ncbi:response regulator transcription factor [Kitasatospora sp. NPDC008050]|uniref:response regulator transcription factor n=1 Tax=Kitasatospora sp. NPDC008050 TaxID=3364021 RepID=UPI0036E1F4ED
MGTQVDQTELSIALVLENALQRFGVEGMIRFPDRLGAVRSFNSSGQQACSALGQRFDLILTASAELACERTRETVRALCAQGARLLLLVDGPDGIDARALAEYEAQGVLDWSELDPATLREAVFDVMAGKFHVSGTLARQLLVRVGQASARAAQPGAPAGAALTPRELEVLRLVAEGLSNKQVSRQLEISEHGVKRHVGNVLTKLNCPNRTLAVVRALEDGLLAV